VLVILIDALRADRLGAYGYERDTSPTIDALANESIVFESAHAQSPWTKPSIPTLFTSLYPVQHGVYEGEAHGRGGRLESDVLADDHTTIAEVFRDAGYETFAVVHNAHLEPELGLAQGFDTYAFGRADAAEINSRFLTFLDERSDRPFFAYLHYLDAHWPFQPAPPHRTRFGSPAAESIFDRDSWKGLRDRVNDGTIELSDEDRRRLDDLHDAGITEIDEQLGELVAVLRERGLLDDTVLLITSDHGEELLDHGRVGHGGTLFREVIEIPLLLRLPGGGEAARRRDVARLIDVFPTLTILAGIEAPPALEGRDLLAPPAGRPELVAETRHKRTYRLSVRDGDWKYVRTYRARGRASDSSPSEPSPLSAGMRVKVKGLFLADRTVHAAKVSLKDPGDDDLELSGAIESVDADAERIRIHSLDVDVSEALAAQEADAPFPLGAGDFVKVEGALDPHGTLVADEVEQVAADDRDDELEGIVEGIERKPRGVFLLDLAGFRVSVDDDTRLKGFALDVIEPGHLDAVEQGPDPFSPTRLLSPHAPPFDEQLFDLASDPNEQVDRIAQPSAPLPELRAALDAWLGRMSARPAAIAERRALSEDTIEDLRALGYVD